MSQSTLADYSILNLIIPATTSFPRQTTHTIYVRPHEPKIQSEDDSRSLFLVNLPIDSTQSHLRAVFASLVGAGRFESVSFETRVQKSKINGEPSSINPNAKKRKWTNNVESTDVEELPKTWDRELRKSGSSAVILLVDEKSVEYTLKKIQKLHKKQKSMQTPEKVWPIWGEGVSSNIPPLGSARYLSHHSLRYPSHNEIQQNVDNFMTEFNAREEARHRLNKKNRNEPDDDGFVTVSRGGRTGPARKEIVEERMAILQEREKKKTEAMEKTGFYRFQGREKRKKEAEDLVHRFQEDQKKVQALRHKKGLSGFKPEE
ncbi:unnamed protein product [Blumeria hordei]|uniref:Ribosomal RNA-processing protein 7 n=2 Tax=Blumeria hordei TaxID=2867405 RepID=A0A383UTL0_BLUHO|nr:ribosomal small subunit assembly protein [Blumeria hordei DH14]SZF02592.1 unnamed protein product [Blumeria hordei]